MTYSRRVKRLRAGWDGICRIEGEPGERRCRIDDISMLGLGVTLTHPSPSQLAGRRISVDVPAMAQLEGESDVYVQRLVAVLKRQGAGARE